MRSELAMINGIAMKGKRVIFPFILLKQNYSNYISKEETQLLAHESVY